MCGWRRSTGASDAASTGCPDVLELRDIEVPSVSDDGVLVRVRAASTNPYDWHFMRGKPLFMRLMFGCPNRKAAA